MKLSLRIFDFFILAAGTMLAIYLYAGFFHPDPYILSYGTNPRKILLFLRIVIPLLYMGSVWLYIAARSRRLDRSSLILLAVSSFMCLWIGYSVADFFYQRWFESHRKEFHPYLQLMPAAYTPPREQVPGGMTVFCIGGSTTEFSDSSGVDWPSRVERTLRESYGMKQVAVSNLGMEWYTSLHTLINYETNLRPHKPSVILYMGSVNDLLQNADFSYFSRGPFRMDYGHFYGPVNRIIDRRSLWHYLRDVIGGLWYAKPRRVITTNSFPGLAAFRQNIGTLIELAKRDSTRVVLMTEPTLIKPVMTSEELSAVGMLKVEAINDSLVWSSQTVCNGMEQYNGALREIAARNNVPLIDLEQAVPKSLTYFRDEVHYSDTTFSVIAPFIAGKLHQMLPPE